MNLTESLKHATNDNLEFIATGGKLSQSINCKWISPSVPLFQIHGVEGVMHTVRAEKQFGNIVCVPLEGSTDLDWSENDQPK